MSLYGVSERSLYEAVMNCVVPQDIGDGRVVGYLPRRGIPITRHNHTKREKYVAVKNAKRNLTSEEHVVVSDTEIEFEDCPVCFTSCFCTVFPIFLSSLLQL
jgi:hypothetical protein